MINKDELLGMAVKARDNAYAPYSHFRVGAAILAGNGKVYTGCNIENSSYGASVCAERVALFKAVSEGEKEFLAIAIATDTEKPVMPCGICRQALSEFALNLKIYAINIDGKVKETSLNELLPDAFTKEDLESVK